MINSKYLIFMGIILFILMCGKPPEDKHNDTGVPQDILYKEVVDKDSITISWDKSENYFDTILYYDLYYHVYPDTSWRILKTRIPVQDNPKGVVYRTELPSNSSLFFFGVRSVTMEGVESDIHSCTDSTAYPPMWALVWESK